MGEAGIERKERADYQSLLDFAEAYPGTPLDRETFQALLAKYGEPSRIFDYWQGRERVLSGFLLDTCTNGNGASELLVIGRRLEAPQSAWKALFDDAEARSFGQGRPLEFAITHRFDSLWGFLQRRGYAEAFSNITMAIDVPRAPTESEHDWRELDEATTGLAHECYRLAFAEVSGGQVPDEDDFRAIMLGASQRPRILLQGGKVAAFCRVVWKSQSERIGELRFVCRHPAFRGTGLGEAAVAEALGQLTQVGAAVAHIEVASNNTPAVRLYRRLGFRELERARVVRRRPGS